MTIAIIVIACIILIVLTYFFIMQYKFNVLTNSLNKEWYKIDFEIDKVFSTLKNLEFTLENYKDIQKAKKITAECTKMYLTSGNKMQTIDAYNKVVNCIEKLTSDTKLSYDPSREDVISKILESEKKINFQFAVYNNIAKEINLKIEKFPSNLVAKILKISVFDILE